MEFVEALIFTKLVRQLLTDKEYGMLQSFLAAHPKIGTVIPGGAGLRKVRWGSTEQGRGKRGGVRVIYYVVKPHLIYMIYIYRKSSREEITKEILMMIRQNMLEALNE